jgi:hypothetical protein
METQSATGTTTTTTTTVRYLSLRTFVMSFKNFGRALEVSLGVPNTRDCFENSRQT